MNTATVQAALSVVRSVMIAAGAFTVTNGLMTQESFDQLVGAVLVLIPLLWGVWQKFQAERATKAKEVIAVHVGMVVADNTVGPTPPIAPIKVPEVIDAIAPRIILPADSAAPPVVLQTAPPAARSPL
jgi:hypothetical protein